MLVWGKSLKRRPLPHAPIPLKPFAILSNELVQNTGQANPVLAAILARATIPPPPSADVIAVSAASFRTEQGLAPGSLAVAFGKFPNGADELRVNGQSAGIFGTSTAAVIFLLPDSANLGPATITVRLGGVDVAQGSATITPLVLASLSSIILIRPSPALSKTPTTP